MTCSQCGKQMNAHAAFCMQCGQTNQRKGAAPAAAPVPQNRTVTFSARAQASTTPSGRGKIATAVWVAGALAFAMAFGAGVHQSGLVPKLRDSLSAQKAPTANPALNQAGVAQPGANLQAQGNALAGAGLQLVSDSTQRNLLEAAGAGNTPVLGATADGAPPLLEASGSSTPPVLQQEAGMPGNVRSYLEHLRRCESQRSQMAGDQVASSLGLLTELQGANMQGLFDEDGPPVERVQPARRVTDSANAMRGPWDGLLRQFNSVQPPVECAPIRSYYDQVIRETGIMILEINHAVQQASNDRQQALRVLMSMQGKSNNRIDRPARETDGLIQSICSKYNTRKWFDVSGDIGGGLMGKGF